MNRITGTSGYTWGKEWHPQSKSDRARLTMLLLSFRQSYLQHSAGIRSGDDWVNLNVRYGSDYSWQASPHLSRYCWRQNQRQSMGKYAAKFLRPFLWMRTRPYHTVQQAHPSLAKKTNQTLRARGREADHQRGNQKLLADSLSSKRQHRPASPWSRPSRHWLTLQMMVKNGIRNLYQGNHNGTICWGFRGTPDWAGQDWNFNGGK